MAGKRKVFEQALREAHNFAWDGRWDEAIRAYQRALAEFPQDVAVRTHLAQAYASAGQWEQAIAEYQQISSLAPHDPLPLVHLAEIMARRGLAAEAIEPYHRAASLYEATGHPEQAAELLEKAAGLVPEHLPTRERLVNLYRTLGKPRAAAAHCLAQARICQLQGKSEQAIQHVLAALEMDPRNPEARQALESLRYGAKPAPVAPSARPARPAMEPTAGATPAETAGRRALAELAEAVFEHLGPSEAEDMATPAGKPKVDGGASPNRVYAALGQAIDWHSRGVVDKAIRHYAEALEWGGDMPALHFALGSLYQQQSQFAQAIEHFTRCLQEPRYTLGSLFAIGECYRAQGDIEAAFKHLIEALKQAELSHVGPEKADELARRYEHLAKRYGAKEGRERAAVFISSLVDFLSGENWEEKVAQARRRLNSLTENGFVVSLAEILEMPRAEMLLTSLELIQDYMARGLYRTAAEECYRAINLAPDYLPLHLRLAGILVAQERIEEAVAKHVAVADTYLARGEPEEAIQVFRQALTLIPMDVTIRTRLIQLLLQGQEVDQALEEYLALADTYYHLAQIDQSVETLHEALRLIPRTSSKVEWETRILHRLGDIYMQRVEWGKAKKVYQRIAAIAPHDTRARRHLIDLAFKLENRQVALKALDEWMHQSEAEGLDEQALEMLRELAQAYPQEMSIHAHLAKEYVKRNMRPEAIAALNVLGELQLDAGLYHEAAETIRQLAGLEPDKAEEYQRALRHILGRQGS